MSTLSQRSVAIMERVRAGKNFAEIAREFDCSREWVRQIAARNGVFPRLKIKARNAEILHAIRSGAPIKVIAHQYRVSPDTVSRIAIKNGVRRRRAPEVVRVYDQATISFICAEKGQKTARELAAQFGITRNAVIGIWRRHCAKFSFEDAA